MNRTSTRIAIAAAVTTLMVSSLAAGAVAQDEEEKFVIGMSQANKGEPWRQAMNDQIQMAADKYPQLEVVFADAAQNNAKQVADVENFITQGIDLLIISPNEAAPLTDVVKKVNDLGIPNILLDRRVEGDDYMMFIGADNVLLGREAGKFVAQWCADQGLEPCNVGEIRGLEGTSGTLERGDGLREGMAENPNIKIVSELNADWLREKAIPVSQQMLTAHPEINVCVGQNDPMAEACIISAEAAGMDLSKMLFVGYDGLPTPDGGIQSVIDGRLGVTLLYPTGGAEAIDYAVKILEEGLVPEKEVTLGTAVITPENAEEMMAQFAGEAPAEGE
jgi:ribose transport system substrate-binding protein